MAEGAYTYNGTAQTPAITGIPAGLVAGADYDVAYANNTDAGAATAAITFKGNYTGAKTISWEIERASIKDAQVSMPASSFTYNGAEQAAAPVVKLGDATLTQGADYTVSGNRATNAGAYTITITGAGSYEGTADAEWTIAAYDISNSSLSFANSGTAYTGSVIEAGTATVTLDVPLAGGTETISQGTDFTISSSSTLSATNAGTYTATAKGKGNFTGECSGTWTIAQADLPDSDIAALKTAIGTPEVYVGTKLSSVTLPTLTGGTLAWSNEYTSVETVGDVTATVVRNAVYTPKDTNYKPAIIAVNINVKKTYTVVYHSNGGTLEGATFDAVNDEYTYSEEIDLDNTTSALTANKFTNEGNTFAYWTLGKSDTNAVADNATNTTLTYVDEHSLADGNGMYTNTSTSSSKTKAAVGATLDLYAHWAVNSTGDYWMAAAGATLPKHR